MEKLLEQIKKKGPKLHYEITKQQQEIADDPYIGSLLKGDLKDFRCNDFKFQGVSLRICYAYFPDDNHIKFLYIGIIENFYVKLKRYIFD